MVTSSLKIGIEKKIKKLLRKVVMELYSEELIRVREWVQICWRMFNVIALHEPRIFNGMGTMVSTPTFLLASKLYMAFLTKLFISIMFFLIFLDIGIEYIQYKF